MSENSDGNKDLAGSSALRCSAKKQLENGIFESDQGQFLLSNSGLKVENKIGQDIGSSRERSGCVSGVGSLLPQQAVSQGTTVCWERFLHVRSLKVLLVESDDCTRHLVAALLQNCSYEVVEAANGFQAWRILEDVSNRIDIVLTEVVMPCVSGLALLNKIMSHKTRKSIPVIMMSSHGSMGVVFKCLSKGAADFLVKPLRKNELKNLWQHVWRRCHSSSGSGSESGTHTKKSVKYQNDEKSDNNSGSNDEEDDGSPPLDFGDGSDHGSGTQNFWTKQAIEEQDESPRSMSPANELSESPDSTCAQVIHSNIKQREKQLEPMSAAKECKEKTEQLVKSEMGKPHISKLSNSSDLLFKSLAEVPVELLSMNHGSSPKLDSSQFSKPLNNAMDLNCVNPATEPDDQVAGIIPGSSDHKESNDSETNNKYSKISNIDGNTAGDGQESQHPEQSLKRLRDTQQTGKVVMDDRNILRRSVSSAFSRYNAALYSKASITDARNSSPLEIRLERTPVATHNMQSCTGSNMPNQRSNGRIPYKDMTSTSNSDFIETINNKDQSSESQRAKHEYHPAVQMHPAHYSGHNNPSIDDLPLQHQPPNGDLLLTEKVESSTHFQSSSMAGRHLEGTAGNYSMNGSGSGSNHGSNEPNGSGSAPNVGGVNMQLYDMTGCQSDNGNASGSGSGSGSGNKLDPDKLAQREAALFKYRQKRKELCFKRTVRYQSRKKLAEQRPRIRGQFVKRTHSETSSKEPTDGQI